MVSCHKKWTKWNQVYDKNIEIESKSGTLTARCKNGLRNQYNETKYIFYPWIKCYPSEFSFFGFQKEYLKSRRFWNSSIFCDNYKINNRDIARPFQMVKMCNGYHTCTATFNKSWTQIYAGSIPARMQCVASFAWSESENVSDWKLGFLNLSFVNLSVEAIHHHLNYHHNHNHRSDLDQLEITLWKLIQPILQ